LDNFSIPPKNRKKHDLKQQKLIVDNLSKALLGPILESLVDERVNDFTIIPDGSLFSIPFAALNLNVGLNESYEPLVSKLSLSYSPSLTIRNLLRTKTSGKEQPDVEALVFANSGYDEISEAHFGLIPFSEIEADYISNVLGSKAEIHKGLDANKDKLSEVLEKKYKVIHFG